MTTHSKAVNEFINHLTPGKIVDLQVAGLSDFRIKPTVIGLDIGNYLLIKLPAKLKNSEYNDIFVSGNIVVLRYIIEGELGECIAFSTTIKHVLSVPERLLFLKYPDRIENRQLRAYHRTKTYLSAQMSLPSSPNSLSTEHVNGYILDISTHGCLFSFDLNTNNVKIENYSIQIYFSISLVNENKPLLVKANIKNHRIQNGRILVGTMFEQNSLAKVSMLLENMSIAP